MTSSSQFIDYFIHDILDYTVLSTWGQQFFKNYSVFCVQDAVHNITRIFNDKAKMKQIKLRTKFVDFSQYEIVKTDKKRLQ